MQFPFLEKLNEMEYKEAYSGKLCENGFLGVFFFFFKKSIKFLIVIFFQFFRTLRIELLRKLYKNMNNRRILNIQC